MVIKLCSNALVGTKIAKVIDVKLKIESTIEKFGNDGERIIAFAFKVIDQIPDNLEASITQIESDLCFVGLASILDPPKEGVAESVNICQRAGVKVAMVTGDLLNTAVAIARMVNILGDEIPHNLDNVREYIRNSSRPMSNENDLAEQENGIDNGIEIQNNETEPLLRPNDSPVQNGTPNNNSENVRINMTNRRIFNEVNSIIIRGQDIDDLSEREWETILKSHIKFVFARTTPEQKLRIVTEFQKRGEIVAVTGDGVNDAPALKKGKINRI